MKTKAQTGPTPATPAATGSWRRQERTCPRAFGAGTALATPQCPPSGLWSCEK